MTAGPLGEFSRLHRPLLRALMAAAALAAAIALAGCDTDGISNGRAQAPLSEKTLAEFASKNMDKESPILIRLFKEESEMEVWKKNRDGQFALLKTYPVCRWSGDLGPKKKEGDRQAPEGFYTITPGQMNPASNYYLAFNTGFPNAYDRAWKYTGSELMVHGDCSSRGCYAMTDEQIQEIYALGRESFFGGQRSFQLQAFPFRMTALNMARHRNNPNFAFWKMIKEGYDHFEASRQEPKVSVCEKRYVFDAAEPENVSKPLAFNPTGKCPVYRLDPTIAEAVLDHQRNEQVQMANYIAQNIAVVPPRHGQDGGMNPVFEAKLVTQEAYDDKGRLVHVTTAPGALPRTSPAPAATVVQPRPDTNAEPEMLASVPMPTPAPQPKVGEAPREQPKSIAGLLDNLFGGNQAKAEAEIAPDPAPQLPARTMAAPKPKRTPAVQVAAAPAAPEPKPAQPAPAKLVRSAQTPAEPAPKLRGLQNDTPAAARPADSEMRTAFSPPPAAQNGMLAGAQPVVPAGNFDSRWQGLR